MANIIVEWHPERKERILLCTHYDTRPHADHDLDPGKAARRRVSRCERRRERRRSVDGARTLDAEIGRAAGRGLRACSMAKNWSTSIRAIRIAWERPGSRKNMCKNPPAHKYRWGVLLDMVGDANLQLYQEHFSATWQETRPLVKSIWATAQRLGVKEFLPRSKYLVSADDHMPLRNTGKIPTCDIIDFVDSSGIRRRLPGTRRRMIRSTARPRRWQKLGGWCMNG